MFTDRKRIQKCIKSVEDCGIKLLKDTVLYFWTSRERRLLSVEVPRHKLSTTFFYPSLYISLPEKGLGNEDFVLLTMYKDYVKPMREYAVFFCTVFLLFP